MLNFFRNVLGLESRFARGILYDRERRAERQRESKLRVSAARESGIFKVHALCIISIKLPRTITPYTRRFFDATLYIRIVTNFLSITELAVMVGAAKRTRRRTLK